MFYDFEQVFLLNLISTFKCLFLNKMLHVFVEICLYRQNLC